MKLRSYVCALTLVVMAAAAMAQTPNAGQRALEEAKKYSGQTLNITWPAGVGGINQPPVVALLPPAGFVHVGDRIALTANASDPDGAVSSVAFQVSGRTIAVDSEGPPFTAVWKPGKAGTYVLVAVATDARALSASSEPVTVTVAPRARR